jgi:hypothetical protein
MTTSTPTPTPTPVKPDMSVKKVDGTSADAVKPVKVAIDGKVYDTKVTADQAITKAYESGKINGKPISTQEGKQEVSKLRHQANGKSAEEAKALSENPRLPFNRPQ